MFYILIGVVVVTRVHALVKTQHILKRCNFTVFKLQLIKLILKQNVNEQSEKENNSTHK